MALPPDEQPPADPGPLPIERDARGLFKKGNTIGNRGRRSKAHKEEVTDPDLLPFDKDRRRYARSRLRELHAAFGRMPSEAVRELVECAASAYMKHWFCDWKIARTGDVELMKLSVRFSETARQHELASWELAAREAKVAPVKGSSAFWDRITSANASEKTNTGGEE